MDKGGKMLVQVYSRNDDEGPILKQLGISRTARMVGSFGQDLYFIFSGFIDCRTLDLAAMKCIASHLEATRVEIMREALGFRFSELGPIPDGADFYFGRRVYIDQESNVNFSNEATKNILRSMQTGFGIWMWAKEWRIPGISKSDADWSLGITGDAKKGFKISLIDQNSSGPSVAALNRSLFF